MNKIDRRKNYFLVVDTETANGLDDALVYDYGFKVVDRHGNVYHQDSMLIYDIFVLERELMQSAYYAEKIPMYEEMYQKKEIRMVRFNTARKLTADVMAEYGITKVWAYNARFDRNALNTTMRYLTKSKYRYFFPRGTEVCCIWSVACQTICQQKAYFQFVEKHDLVTKGRVKTSAEVVYQFLEQNRDFVESHTALEDVGIETQILAKVLRQHRSLDTIPRRFPTSQVNKAYKEWKVA